ncbi:hypothetical protein CWI37_0600p0020 [Hamiltosporidium tvaerminnensis]|uniref:Uncharacterized protein n=2 Tax=Hamiltosporidium TaxID=1176354 RepID=A0A4V2JWX2_9MICR|nr:hypothetical protein CWI37_0600p0020 [Hamiltosporidium tvaerminnensis]TBU09522.1 hypothetical protein CWI36_0022p0030 [Hamiltosporidium magnivora]
MFFIYICFFAEISKNTMVGNGLEYMYENISDNEEDYISLSKSDDERTFGTISGVCVTVYQIDDNIYFRLKILDYKLKLASEKFQINSLRSDIINLWSAPTEIYKQFFLNKFYKKFLIIKKDLQEKKIDKKNIILYETLMNAIEGYLNVINDYSFV